MIAAQQYSTVDLNLLRSGNSVALLYQTDGCFLMGFKKPKAPAREIAFI
jgi:hypothetical protein